MSPTKDNGDNNDPDGTDYLPGLADLLAPMSAQLHEDYVRVGDDLSSTLVVQGYPRYVYPGWIAPLVDLDLPFLELDLHLRPRSAQAMIRTLRRRLTEFDASRRLDARQGRLQDPEREVATEDVSRLIDQLQRGEETILETAFYATVRATGRSRQTLRHRVEQLHSALDALGLEGRLASFDQELAFRSVLPLALDDLRRTRLLDASTVATAFPFTSMTLSMPSGILFGVVPTNNSLIVLDPYAPQLENANLVIFAKSGAGKSYFTKVLALRSLMTGTAVCVIDPEPLEEYAPLAAAVGGEYIRLAPGAGQQINPFDLPIAEGETPETLETFETGEDDGDEESFLDDPTSDDQTDGRSDSGSDEGSDEGSDGVAIDQDGATSVGPSTPTRRHKNHQFRRAARAGTAHLVAEKIQSLLSLLALLLAEGEATGQSARLSTQEKALLDQALWRTYARAGITDDPRTYHRLPPTLRDLYLALREIAEGGAPGGVVGSAIDAVAQSVAQTIAQSLAQSLADRLQRFVEGSLAGLFAGQTTVALDHPLVVFSIRDLDDDLRPIGLWLITDFVWTRMRRERGRQPRLLMIDEAWTLVQHPDGGRFLASLARRARKYYLGLVTITQDVADFLANPYGQTVLNQASIHLLMRQSATTIHEVGAAFHLSDGERRYLLTCDKGHGLIFARNAHAAIRVVASPFEHTIATTNPRELAMRRPLAGAAAPHPRPHAPVPRVLPPVVQPPGATSTQARSAVKATIEATPRSSSGAISSSDAPSTTLSDALSDALKRASSNVSTTHVSQTTRTAPTEKATKALARTAGASASATTPTTHTTSAARGRGAPASGVRDHRDPLRDPLTPITGRAERLPDVATQPMSQGAQSLLKGHDEQHDEQHGGQSAGDESTDGQRNTKRRPSPAARRRTTNPADSAR